MSARAAVARLWQPPLSASRRALWLALTPPSALYAGALALHTRWWRGRAQRAPVATIGVGNLTVGGNGKTPFTLFLANRLRELGFRVAIASRGYGRTGAAAGATLVAAAGRLLVDPATAGDEPAMMAHAFAGPIAVGRRRLDAIALLAAQGPLDAVILDDAFQHRRLRRDLDLVLIAAPRGIGNGWLLPAGPLREPLSALRRADAVILLARDTLPPYAPPAALRTALSTGTVLDARVQPRGLIHSHAGIWTAAPLDLKGRRVVAVSGLAEPEEFAATLRGLGAHLVQSLAYPDHHRYGSADWATIRAAASRAELVVTTAKDLVKLERFSPGLPSLYAVGLAIVMDDAAATRLLASVINCIESRRLAAVKD